MSEKCYYCDRDKVSDEHVPPKTLFDTKSQTNLNLFKVPSCEIHNNDKSDMDDCLFFMIKTTATHDNEDVLQKLCKKMQKNKKLQRCFDKDKQVMNFTDEIWKELATYFDMMACALYYKLKNHRINENHYCNVVLLSQVGNDDENSQYNQIFELNKKKLEHYTLQVDKWQQKGREFKYSIDNLQNNTIRVSMKFFDNVRVDAFYSKQEISTKFIFNSVEIF
ncbi:hypothetical protein [Francisella salimarina]|uniref:hypothetical protein n=1 Tax=Francisella salimarina TaxID=2599927 RepID=UPI003D818BD4